jgi:serine/threonine protein kinase
MALSAGTRVGCYEVVSALGIGGMGEVYRARDVKLNREVAIKVLLAAVANDPERLARFGHEAQVLASLNHPNIAHIHGFEDSGGVHALVMELVEGPTLADRIAKGAIPVDDALVIAKQIAEALEAAHERGVVHRDLKPANVKVRPDGMVKVLDFGLAKALDPPAGSDAAVALANSPTFTSPAVTQRGVILGTAAYMSPEQAKGRAADKRTDVWAFGCVLYEMLTARRAFGGEDVADTLASVLTRNPDWTVLPTNTPTAIRKLLRRCLERDRRRRLADIADAKLEIDDALAADPSSPSLTASAQTAAIVIRRSGIWRIASVFAVAALIASGAGWWIVTRSAATAQVIRFSVSPPPNLAFATTQDAQQSVSVSPDGLKLAFVTRGDQVRDNQLWVRPLDALAAKPIPGTESALNPIWSPDGRFIAFSAALAGIGRLRKVDISGAPPVTLAEAGVPGAWSRAGVILFRARDGRIYRVSPSADDLAPVTELDRNHGEIAHYPQFFLSDDRRFVFLAQNADAGRSAVFLAALDSTNRTRVLDGVSKVSYSRGHLIYQRESTVLMQPFDERTGSITGPAASLIDDVDTSPYFGQAAYSISPNVVAYRVRSSSGASALTWLSREGKALAALGLEGGYQETRRPALSPDHRRLAVTRYDAEGKSDIWIIDLDRDVPTRFTFDGTAETPAWSPDGTRIVFSSRRKGTADLYERAAAGAGSDQLLYESPDPKRPGGFSPDGKTLLYTAIVQGNAETWALPLDSRKPFPLVRTGYPAGSGVFSPDGRWFAYCEGDSGADQVYVQPFPQNGTRIRLSTTSGSSPLWSADGRTVFYATASGNRIMAVNVTPSGRTLRAGQPRLLFVAPQTFAHRGFLADPSGSRFLLPVSREAEAPPAINIVVNWFEEVKARVATK